MTLLIQEKDLIMENRREFLKKTVVAGSVFVLGTTTSIDKDVLNEPKKLGVFKVQDMIDKAYCNISTVDPKDKEKRKKVVKLPVKNVTVDSLTNKHTVNFKWFDTTKAINIISYQVVAPDGKKGVWRNMKKICMINNDSLRIFSEEYEGKMRQ